MAESNTGGFQGTPPRGLASLMERTHRGVFLVATLKREEMFRQGRHEELDRMLKDTREPGSGLA